MKVKSLRFYRRIVDSIVAVLIFIMMLTLMGAVVGLIFDVVGGVRAVREGIPAHALSHGLIDSVARDLVIDVLSVFVLIELFRTFTDYLEFHRIRLRVLSEVGIAFIMREIFIGLYNHSVEWPEILALTALLAVLVAARVTAVRLEIDRPDAGPGEGSAAGSSEGSAAGSSEGSAAGSSEGSAAGAPR
jgi:uncharacterized membrane protein (DUF373 family)